MRALRHSRKRRELHLVICPRGDDAFAISRNLTDQLPALCVLLVAAPGSCSLVGVVAGVAGHLQPPPDARLAAEQGDLYLIDRRAGIPRARFKG